jgi:hypothetical protein
VLGIAELVLPGYPDGHLSDQDSEAVLNASGIFCWIAVRMR